MNEMLQKYACTTLWGIKKLKNVACNCKQYNSIKPCYKDAFIYLSESHKVNFLQFMATTD